MRWYTKPDFSTAARLTLGMYDAAVSGNGLPCYCQTQSCATGFGCHIRIKDAREMIGIDARSCVTYGNADGRLAREFVGLNTDSD